MLKLPEYDGGRRPDALNPLALAYARAQLARHGVRAPQGQDPAALWRAVSAILFQQRPQPAPGPALPPSIQALLAAGRLS